MKKMRILIAGDYCTALLSGKDSVLVDPRGYLSTDIKELIKSHDLAAVNVETVLTDEGQPIFKDGPNLKQSPELAGYLKECGFGLAMLANNHIGDYGEKGVTDTIDTLKKSNLATTGAGISESDAAQNFDFDRLSIINIAENEYGIAVGNHAGCSGLNDYSVYNRIRSAKSRGQFVLVVVHGGNEHCPFPSPVMRARLRSYVSAGADFVIGGHTHCPQGTEVFDGVPICYSMGNFVFDMGGMSMNKMWYIGYMVSIEIADGRLQGYSLIPHYFANHQVHLLSGDGKLDFDKYLAHISSLIQDTAKLENYWMGWCSVYGKIRSGMLSNKAFLRNSYNCESHRELMADFFKNETELVSGKYNAYADKIVTLQRGEYTNEKN